MLKPGGYQNGYLILLVYVLLTHYLRERDETVKDVFDTLNDEDKDVVYQLVGEALEAAEKGLSITRFHPNLKHFSAKQIKVALFLIDEAVKSKGY
jgi:hypothetical protein